MTVFRYVGVLSKSYIRLGLWNIYVRKEYVLTIYMIYMKIQYL